jgi:hypothetical protein
VKSVFETNAVKTKAYYSTEAKCIPLSFLLKGEETIDQNKDADQIA